MQLRNLLTRRCDLVVNGRYKIGRKLARGAFGQIRLGRHMVTKEGQSRSFPCIAIMLLRVTLSHYDSIGVMTG